MSLKYKLKKGDIVQIMTGRAKDKRDKNHAPVRAPILKILRGKDKVLVEGVKMVKKTVRARSENEKGDIIEQEAPIHISNVQIVCSKCGPTRIGIKGEGKSKERICKKCGEKL